MAETATQRIIVDLPDGHTLRLTIGKMAMWDMALYNVLRREGWAWLEAQGITPVPVRTQPAPEGEAAEPPEHAEMRTMVVARAQMVAAVMGVAWRTGEDGEWEEGAMPAEWEGVEGFVRHVPAALSNIWHRWALVLNPTVFFQTMGEPEKNGDAVIVF